MKRIFGTRCCKGVFSKDCLGCAGGTVSFLPHRLSSALRGPHFCADRNGGKNGQGACGPHWIPGVMFYSDLTNRCSTCSHWYSARILIRGGVLTHCFRLFVPTAGAGQTLKFAQCTSNGGQSCTVQRPLCVKGPLCRAEMRSIFVACSGAAVQGPCFWGSPRFCAMYVELWNDRIDTISVI